MDKKEILTKLIDDKKAAILQTVLNSKEEMYLKEISEKSNVSITSTFRILKEFVNWQILDKKEWKTSKVYFCQNNEHVDFLKDLFTEQFDGLQEFVQIVGELEGVNNIVLHGAKKKGKASILLIGPEIDADKVDEICKDIKIKGFEVNFMALTKEQYAQMTKMGLYAGEKKVLK